MMLETLHAKHGVEKLMGIIISSSDRPYPYSAVGLLIFVEP